VQVASHPGHAYQRLWLSAVDTLAWSALSFVFVFVFVFALALALTFARILGSDGELVTARMFFPMSARVGLAGALDRIIISAVIAALPERGANTGVVIN